VSLDQDLLIRINQGWADPGLDFLFGWISEQLWFSIPLLLGLLIYLRRLYRQDGVRLWLLLILAVILGDMLGNLLKAWFAMPRPCYDLFELLRPPGGGAPRQCDAAFTGMPSNHALNFFAVTALLAYATRRLALSGLLLLISLAVGLSRIYLAKHYPSQVLAGAGLGALFGWSFAWLGLRTFTFGRRFLQPGTPQAGRSAAALSPVPVPLGQNLLGAAGEGGPNPLWLWLPPALGLFGILVIGASGTNQDLFLVLNRLSRLTGDGVWAYLTLLGDTLVALVLLAPLVRQRPEMLKAILLAILFATLWVHILKPLIDHPRPLAVLAPEQVHVIGKVLYQNSFPSGHTTTAFALAGMFVLSRVRPWLAAAVLGLAMLAGVSRAVVGAHWPLDILAGAFGGWLSAVLGIRLSRSGAWRPGRWTRFGVMLILIGCALALLLNRDLGYPQAIPLQMLVGLFGLFYLLPAIRANWRQSFP
jgi:membrane-associated phospholipid phosphatase